MHVSTTHGMTAPCNSEFDYFSPLLEGIPPEILKYIHCTPLYPITFRVFTWLHTLPVTSGPEKGTETNSFAGSVSYYLLLICLACRGQYFQKASVTLQLFSNEMSVGTLPLTSLGTALGQC